MISIRSKDFQSIFIRLLGEVMDSGDDVIVRGQRTKELLSCHLSVSNPTNVCYFIPHRKDNIFARIAETLWVLAGRNDIEWLTYYMPRAPDYSDNGHDWRAGYGKRLRHWDYYGEGGWRDEVDQIRTVASKLSQDPTTRQAVMTIWRPEDDNVVSLDIPCNNWLHFIVRRFGTVDYLFLNIAQRSADLFWGWSNINAFEWATLLKMMAFWTDTEVGDIEWLVTSLHMYERHFNTARKILDSSIPTYHFDMGWQPKFSTPFKELDGTLGVVFMYENKFRNVDIDTMPKIVLTGDGFLDTMLHMLGIYIHHKKGSSDKFIMRMIADMPECEFKYAALLHIARERKDIIRMFRYNDYGHDMVRSVLHAEGL